MSASLAMIVALTSVGPALAEAEMPAAETTVMAPSGFDVTLHEVLFEEQPFSGETLIVVRLVAPAITSRVFAANLQADMEWACQTWGAPTSNDLASPADRIVVELMAEVVPRGEPAPDIRQFFETYSLQDGVCIWELF